MSSAVVVTNAAAGDYSRDYVALPREYGTRAWYARPDVCNIAAAVTENLSSLDAKTRFSEKLRGRRVLIKPNLVTVFHKAGFVQDNYPNTTDPRVIEAVVIFLAQYTKDIVIVESSGRGMPTRGSFRLCGLDRLARRHGVTLVALEEQGVDQYYLPRAKVMKHMLLPEIFRGVIRGEDFYISMPKMKTNMYTQVTLGFKNSMGCIPYNLRQMNHNYDLEQKLVDMLWLFQPDLVVIDGIVGAEGQCPAPVDPVDSRVIVSGTNSVETDRVATRIMGFAPENVKLMELAEENGFGDPNTKVYGEVPVCRFRPANPSLLGKEFKDLFPNVRVLIGHSNANSPKIIGTPCPETLHALEYSCRGGCLATTRLGFEFLHYEGLDRQFPMTVVIGSGAETSAGTRWFDRDGRGWQAEEIDALPGQVLCVGDCACARIGRAARITGCMVFPNSVHMKLHTLTKTKCRVANPLAPKAPLLLRATWKMRRQRMALLKQGRVLDYPPGFRPEEPELTPEQRNSNFVSLILPAPDRKQVRALVKAEWQEIKDLIFY